MTQQPAGDQGEERLRLFVAIELPDAWKEAFARLQNEMRQALAAQPDTEGVRVRWVRPEGVHVTLKFLGEVLAGRVDSINWALAQALPLSPGFDLSLASVGSFSDRRAPRVVWAGITSPKNGTRYGKIFELAERVETWLAAADFPRERRGFTPHLTLARLPEDLAQPARERIAEVLNAFGTPNVAPFRVERVSLMRSHLGPGGARYERLSAFPS